MVSIPNLQVLILASIFGKGVAEVPVTWVEMPGSKLNLLTGAVTMLRDMALVQARAYFFAASFGHSFSFFVFLVLVLVQIKNSTCSNWQHVSCNLQVLYAFGIWQPSVL